MEETHAVDVTSNKVRNYIPLHIIFFILSKLPLKSLKRFECVCKLWSNLFQNSYFMTIYTNNLMSNSNSNHYDDTYLNLECGQRYRGHKQFCLRGHVPLPRKHRLHPDHGGFGYDT
jgi:hypothetical protein